MKTTKLLYLVTLIFGLLSSCGFTASRFSSQGFYIHSLDFIYCTSQETCIHEQAHRLDRQHGDISKTTEFAISVTLFAIRHPECVWSEHIMAYETSWEEVYARMYGSVNGNIDMMPAELRRFYE
jgi:hypothetical protein